MQAAHKTYRKIKQASDEFESHCMLASHYIDRKKLLPFVEQLRTMHEQVLPKFSEQS